MFVIYTEVPINAIISFITNNTATIDVGGNLWIVGPNEYRELGVGTDLPVDDLTPISIGVPHVKRRT